MTKKYRSITNKLYPISLLVAVIIMWQLLLSLNIVDAFMLPSPLSVIKAFCKDFALLIKYSGHTLFEAFSGLFISILLGLLAAISMDRFRYVRKALYPLLVLSQTVPYIAIAPLLVVWFGYGMTPKIILVVFTCFFPMSIGIYDGIKNISSDYLDELEVLGGTYLQGVVNVKIPLSLPGFFSALKIAVTYCIVGTVVAEWIGGTTGLGVYMTRVRKSYEFDKMFAVIFLIAIVSLILIALVKFIEKRALKNV